MDAHAPGAGEVSRLTTLAAEAAMLALLVALRMLDGGT